MQGPAWDLNSCRGRPATLRRQIVEGTSTVSFLNTSSEALRIEEG